MHPQICGKNASNYTNTDTIDTPHAPSAAAPRHPDHRGTGAPTSRRRVNEERGLQLTTKQRATHNRQQTHGTGDQGLLCCCAVRARLRGTVTRLLGAPCEHWREGYVCTFSTQQPSRSTTRRPPTARQASTAHRSRASSARDLRVPNGIQTSRHHDIACSSSI